MYKIIIIYVGNWPFRKVEKYLKVIKILRQEDALGLLEYDDIEEIVTLLEDCELLKKDNWWQKFIGWLFFTKKDIIVMPCFLVLIALCLPRVTLFFIWILTSWFRAFDTSIWPFLGFIFMPYTTLSYMASMLNNDNHVSGWWLVLVIVAALIDLGSSSSASSSSKSSA